MAELYTLSPANWNDNRKKKQLLANVRTAEGVAYLIQTCRDNISMTFDHCATYLRKNSILIDNANILKTPTRLMHVIDSGTEQEEKTQEQVIYIFNTMARIDGAVKTYAAFQMRSFRENLSIPEKIRAELEPSFKEEIAKIRSRLCTKNRQGSQGSQAPSQTPTPGKPVGTPFA